MLFHQLPIAVVVPACNQQIPADLRSEITLPAEQLIPKSAGVLASLTEFHHPLAGLFTNAIVSSLVNMEANEKNAVLNQWSNQTPLWKNQKTAAPELRKQLINDYYRPFHQSLAALVPGEHLRLVLEIQILPESLAGTERPGRQHRFLVGLANQGDERGEVKSTKMPVTCPPQLLRDFRDILTAVFFDANASVRLNQPVASSYCMQQHARPELHWIRLDLHPQLVLGAAGALNPRQLEKTRERLEQALVMLCTLESWIASPHD